MDKKRMLGILLLGFSLIVLFWENNFVITGNVVGDSFSFSFVNVVGFVLLFISLLILASKKTLDAIIIPTGGSKEEDLERAKKGKKEKAKYYVLSGDGGSNPLPESSWKTIYDELRRCSIKPSQMKVEGKSTNTLENAIFSLKKLQGMKDIGIVSYPKHLERFKLIINKLREEKYLTKDMKITYIPTEETIKQKIYGHLALLKERYRLRNGIKESEKHRIGKFENFLKKIIGG